MCTFRMRSAFYMMVVVVATRTAVVVTTEDAYGHVDANAYEEDNRYPTKPFLDSLHATGGLADGGHTLAEEDGEDHHGNSISETEEDRHEPRPTEGLHHCERDERTEIEQPAIRTESESEDST